MTLFNMLFGLMAVVVMVGLVKVLGFRFDRGNVGLLVIGAVAIGIVLAVWPLH